MAGSWLLADGVCCRCCGINQFLSNSESRLALDGTTALAAVVMGTRLVVANG